ncbi:Rne/Rng family ribonuclease [Desulfovibrio desulfuricans]|uniref:Rne/Rng family ribonuclease n=1 Tax=Desulfovibrio desulfuricans TaxID=876 RepID=UPI0035B45247
MTIDQDTPVAASQPATDASSQEVSKPKRTPSTRSRAKTASQKATGKAASKTAESVPAQGATDAPAPQAAPAPKTAAKSTAAKTSRSTGKSTKPAAAKSKKTADAAAQISADAQGATPAEAAAQAAPAGKSSAKAAAGRSAARGKTARKPKVTETAAPASTPAISSGDTTTPVGETAKPAKAAPKKTAARGTRARQAKSAEAPAADAAAVSAAAPAPEAAKPAHQPARHAAQKTARAEAAPTAAKAAPAEAQETAAATETDATERGADNRITDKFSQGQAEQPQNAAPMTERAAQGAGDAAEAVTASDATAEDPAASAGDAAAGDSPRRKNRRGRRGGRGRNRKKEQQAQEAEEAAQAGMLADDDALDDALNDDIDGIDLDGDQPEATQEQRPQQPPRQARQQQGKPEAVKPAEGGKNANAGKTAKTSAEGPKGRRRMFISVLPGEQVEVALAEDGQLLEYYLDMLHQRKIKGNIYKGVIHNIDTNLQAAFVSYGAGKNGFLQIDEVHPEYWLTHHEPSKGKKFPPIQKVLKAGQEVLVQVVKEPTGSKGAFLTTWLSLAGRFLVLTPGQDQIGVSRKVDDDEERSRLREMMNGIDPGQGLGVIVRTVSAGTTKTTLKNDLQYLKRVWRDIRKKATEVSAPSLIYQEPGLSERAVRDYLTEDVSEIWVDSEEVAQSVRDTVNLLFPRRRDLVRMHTDMRTPMWERFNLRRQLEQIYSREVLLPSGGRLVFDQTEALMAIDINSGKISGKGNFEAMAHKTNMEAAEAIARHLKLRDIGGQVVIDFIEMRDKKHVLEVEKTLRTAMKNDRARHDVARMSSFGLLELVRQRTGSSALAISLEPCPACGGTGMRRNIEWQALQALRELRRMMSVEPKEKCVYAASPELALYLLNHKRDTLREIEQDYGKCLEIMVRP